jgi:DNA-binding PadR family transcriptional regulator
MDKVTNNREREREREIDALLPLSPATFHILVALADESRHGFGIIRDVTERTGGALRLGPGTLYRTLQQMLEGGLIAEVRQQPSKRDEDRRRYYRITAFGTAAAKAETRRLAGLVRMARARGLSPKGA